MRYFYLAPEGELTTLFSDGIYANDTGTITLIELHESFLIDKFIFDALAHEVYKLDVYCLFSVLEGGIQGELKAVSGDHEFSEVLKTVTQPSIDRKFLAPYKTDINYEGMGFVAGVFPVENREKFTPSYKQKILEYLKALG